MSGSSLLIPLLANTEKAEPVKEGLQKVFWHIPGYGLTPWTVLGFVGFVVAGINVLMMIRYARTKARPILTVFRFVMLLIGLALVGTFYFAREVVPDFWFKQFPGIVVTGWKIVGFVGVALFTGRWFVQLYYSRHAGRPVLPLPYWFMSILGSLLLLSYFIFGKTDSVGVLSNLFPVFVAAYNLTLELRLRRKEKAEAMEAEIKDSQPTQTDVSSTGEILSNQ